MEARGTPQSERRAANVAIVGGGAAGLATAVFLARLRPAFRIVILDGAAKIGAKILVSGGGRCNLTNQQVTSDDYFGGSRHVIRRVLTALPVPETVAFFQEIGVAVHREDDGKLFPDSNSARTVVEALLAELRRANVEVAVQHRVEAIQAQAIREPGAGGPKGGGFDIDVRDRPSLRAERVVIATGGLSLPKTGSDGGGYKLAASLGHSLVATTPALAPLVLDGAIHAEMAGVTHDAELTVNGTRGEPIRGSLLWTHSGTSGPAPMNLSRVFHRVTLEAGGAAAQVRLCVAPGLREEEIDRSIANRPGSRQALARALAEIVADTAARADRKQLGHEPAPAPQRVIERLLATMQVDPSTPMAHLSREARRRAAQAVCSFPLPVRDSRGYASAEATAGGVPLSEIHAATMESRIRPGLYFVGEILDVDGRIGGNNFQWAWSSAMAAARGIHAADG